MRPKTVSDEQIRAVVNEYQPITTQQVGDKVGLSVAQAHKRLHALRRAGWVSCAVGRAGVQVWIGQTWLRMA